MNSELNVESLDVLPLAARGATLERDYRLIDLARLSDWVFDKSDRAQLSVRFDLVDRRVSASGKAAAKLRFVCQRCLEPVQIAVSDDFHVMLVATEKELEQLPEDQDAVIVDSAHFEPSWLLEEQLLLAMPLVPLHATLAECAVSASAQIQEGVNGQALAPRSGIQETQRPFADLRMLLSKGSKEQSK